MSRGVARAHHAARIKLGRQLALDQPKLCVHVAISAIHGNQTKLGMHRCLQACGEELEAAHRQLV